MIIVRSTVNGKILRTGGKEIKKIAYKLSVRLIVNDGGILGLNDSLSVLGDEISNENPPT